MISSGSELARVAAPQRGLGRSGEAGEAAGQT